MSFQAYLEPESLNTGPAHTDGQCQVAVVNNLLQGKALAAFAQA